VENSNLERAHNLRRSGQINDAITLYNHLIDSNPSNPEYIFGKALCYMENNPLESIKLFKHVIDLNPGVTPAYGNIVVAANNAKNYTEAIKYFDEFVEKFPNNFDLLHQRAILIGNNGDNIAALLDCYRVVDSTVLKDDAEMFRKHQISTDIAFAKVQLINETNSKKVSNLSLFDKYESVNFVLYHYQLPTRLFGGEKYYLEFGKYQGYSINEVVNIEPSYLIWCIINLDNFCLSEEIIEMIRRKNINVDAAIEINIVKLLLLRSKDIDENWIE
jgi:tetratricopeptide (TPR) repeat protein